MDISTSRKLVPNIREASRLLVRELGFMSPTFATTELPPSAVHAIIEIGQSAAITASTLSKTLSLDRSNISRTVAKLVEARAVVETPNALDGRQKILSITDEGREILSRIDNLADEQVVEAMSRLPVGSSAELVFDGIRAYAAALRAQRLGEEVKSVAEIIVTSGYRPGLLGRCLEMHMRYYSSTVGFGISFESQLASGLGELLNRMHSPKNEVWSATDGVKILGTVFIDGDGLGENKAHLRAFIVDDKLRGHGFGRKLVEKAMAFVDEQRFSETHLYTFKGLDAARRLYETCGFTLVEETLGNKWGKKMMIQHFARKLGGAASSQDLGM
jgi:DNA-binding MarR family transcriptional regulator/GNAT superfamily N-acetyltransferase